MSAAQYRIVSATGTELESGGGDVSVADGALVLAPSAGTTLRVPFAHISSVSEPQPFTVRITLADGNAVELSRLGTMRTQLLAELRDGRGDDAANAAAAVGKAETFSGEVAGVAGAGGAAGGAAGAVPAEIRVYEDALLVLADQAAERIGFSFIEAVQSQNYVVTVSVGGRSPVVLTRLGRRTDEFVALVTERLREARGRTAAFLGALLPGLDPMALRSAAGLLRDGVVAPARTLDGIHPDLTSTLLRVATLPDRYDAVAALAGRADVALGFKQLASVRKAAEGVTPWHDPSAQPHIGEHDSPGGTFRPGLQGAFAAGMMERMGPGGFAGQGEYGGYGPGGYGGYGGGPGGYGGGPGGYGGGPGGYGGYGYGGYGYGGPFGEIGGGYGMWGAAWALRALGAGMNSSQSRPMTPRADVTRGLLTPETEDLSALTATGDNPTVLAFAMYRQPHDSRAGHQGAPGAPGGRVAYEVLNAPEPMTYVYQTDGDDGIAAINRALDDAGFHPAAVHAEGLTAAARPDARTSLLARSLLAQVPHDADWSRRMAELLAG